MTSRPQPGGRKHRNDYFRRQPFAAWWVRSLVQGLALPRLRMSTLVRLLVTEMWRFVPTNPNGTIDVADSAYVSFGWWLNAMGTEGDEYEFDAFASVEGMEANEGTGVALKGSATYKGGAAGKLLHSEHY